MNMKSHDGISDYEYMYEVGCLILYLSLHRVMGFYSLHSTSIAWVVYILGWYYVGLSYDT